MKKLVMLLLLVSSTTVLAQEEDTSTVEPIITESTVTTKTDTNLKSPPASAISPTINTSNSDLCTFGVAGAIQTQILGVSTGTQFTDDNCEMLKNAKTLYDMGMKVAAVSVMCQDQRVFDAMMNAGTPCPKDGLIGAEAKAAWEVETESEPEALEVEKKEFTSDEKTLMGAGGVLAFVALLLFL
jgi:hypothetical protein